MAGLCQAGEEEPQLRNGVIVAYSALGAIRKVPGGLNERRELEAHNSHFFFCKFYNDYNDKNNKKGES